MTYSPHALPYVLHLAGFCREEIEAECEQIYAFIMDFSENWQSCQSVFANLGCSLGSDDAHPLFRFDDPELELEAARLLKNSPANY
jgi:hypothetical protein